MWDFIEEVQAEGRKQRTWSRGIGDLYGPEVRLLASVVLGWWAEIVWPIARSGDWRRSLIGLVVWPLDVGHAWVDIPQEALKARGHDRPWIARTAAIVWGLLLIACVVRYGLAAAAGGLASWLLLWLAVRRT